MLSEKLKEYNESDMYRFHMPGHKGQSEKIHYQMDITEIDGFDNLHDAQGILQERMRLAAEEYGTLKTCYLVNGSTCGILSAISAVANPGDSMLIARNSHKSAYHATFLRQLKNSYIYPQFVDKVGINGGISPENVKKSLNCLTNCKGLWITSPTYEGVVSDIRGIAEVVHERGIPLIVDEAHGAHFGRHSYFPESAIACGADIVIQSTHKTLNAMTQTALLHICSDKYVDVEKIQRYLGIYQSSSPSYILMSSIDDCLEELRQIGKEKFDNYVKSLTIFYKSIDNLQNIVVGKREDYILEDGVHDFDAGKIVISAPNTGYSGEWIYHRLREKYHLQPEMCCGDYVICMTSYMDTAEGFERLASALKEIDGEINGALLQQEMGTKQRFSLQIPEADVVYPLHIALEMPELQRLLLPEAEGKICGEYVYLYPPGIPILAPGERITKDVLQVLNAYAEAGHEIGRTPVKILA